MSRLQRRFFDLGVAFVFVAFFSLLLFVPVYQRNYTTDTGWVEFQNVTTVGGYDDNWTSTAQTITNSSNYGYVDLPKGDISYWLEATNPNLGSAIPSGATIDAVYYRVKRGADNTDCFDYILSPIKAGVHSGSLTEDTAQWPTTAATHDYGGDLCGTTWAPSDFDTDFGLALTVENQHSSSRQARVYIIYTKIQYTEASTYSGVGILLASI